MSTKASPLRLVVLVSVLTPLGSACSEDADAGKPMLSRAQLLDAESCKDCHPKHYAEWSASMHAYALEDPVFAAMNARGQEETNGELGDFCVSCHAPMAVREGAFADGHFENLEQIEKPLRGVTCYFCHNAVDVERDHDGGLTFANAALVLANDQTMRAGLREPEAVRPWAHDVAYSERHENRSPKSSELCGTCHDIVTPAGVHLERTYQEYLSTFISKPGDGFNSCQTCHMKGLDDEEEVARYEGVSARTRHPHLFPAVDVALTPFPGREALVQAVERLALPQSLGSFVLEPTSMDGLNVKLALETLVAHAQPSGASQDRRIWVELRALEADGSVRFQSGVIADDAPEEIPKGEPGHDPNLCMLRDRLFDTEDPEDPDAREVHMFWEARSFSSKGMPPPFDNIPGSHGIDCKYDLHDPKLSGSGGGGRPAHIHIRVRMRPMGRDVLQDLVDSGHLDAAVLDEMKTFTLFETDVVPDPNSSTNYIVSENQVPVDETGYLCLLHGGDDCGRSP